jgi:hypothetical protein
VLKLNVGLNFNVMLLSVVRNRMSHVLHMSHLHLVVSGGGVHRSLVEHSLIGMFLVIHDVFLRRSLVSVLSRDTILHLTAKSDL